MKKISFLQENQHIKEFKVGTSDYRVYLSKMQGRLRWVLRRDKLRMKLNNAQVRRIAKDISNAEDIWNKKRSGE